MRTVSHLPFNLSPKAVLAFGFPLVASIGATVASWIASGKFDATEIRTAAGGVVLSGIALVGAYVGKPSPVALPEHEEHDIHDAVGA